MIQTMYTLDGHQGLSVQERLQAASDGLRQVGASAEDLGRLVVGIAAVALAIAVAMVIAGRVRRSRWIARHQRMLRASGLQPEEVALFGRLARRCDAARVPILVRNRGAFDAAASEHVRHHSPASDRLEELSRVLSLRRRVPFDRAWQERPRFESGDVVTIVARLDDRRIRQIDGRVLGLPKEALQLGLQVRADDTEVAGRLRTGREVMLVVRRGAAIQEARVRIRGRCVGTSLQLLVDRPVALTASRVRHAWNAASERIAVEMIERFSERLLSDEVPRQEAEITAVASDGLVARFQSVRPRHGEAIRVLSGVHAGFYRGYAVLAASGKGGEVFLLRRQGERASERPSLRSEAARPASGRTA
jgi:hypothetical protein